MRRRSTAFWSVPVTNNGTQICAVAPIACNKGDTGLLIRPSKRDISDLKGTLSQKQSASGMPTGRSTL